ncbi:MAG: SagB/ThcOx family dehydrogenase [Tannerella sp.]|jgi:SagB-type dehydrogenase family enzyme|nr:SagB/ThcOx family dehydrogenase [Tannerella sp.]
MKTLLLFIAVLFSSNSFAQELKEIKLNAPNKSRGSAVMKALSDRHSDREFAAKDLSLQDLSDLLWAANGVNRQDGKRTAPSAKNCQEIEVYVVNKEGTYFYDPATHVLKPLTKGDFRKSVASGQDFAATAPVCIVIAANLEKLGDPAKEQTRLIAAMDGGIVNQNINIFCASTNLSTVPRATMNKDELKTALKLTDNHLLILNNPVGYPKTKDNGK